MKTYVGLDVSQKLTSICVIDAYGEYVWEGVCTSNPIEIARTVNERAPDAELIGFETGPLAVWHWHALRDYGLPVLCLHARHAHAAIKMQVNKTDQNDAYALAQIVRTGWYRAVEVKSMDVHRIRLMLTARARVVAMRTTLYSQIRGLLKTFGIVLPPAKGGSFENLVREAISSDAQLQSVIGSLLGIWCSLTDELCIYDREVDRAARNHEVCRLLMTTPGVGSLTALAFVTALDNPHRFRRSTDVGAYLGLTPRRYQSGEVDRVGMISKCGDRMARSLLFEAAHILLTRIKTQLALQSWGRH